MVRSSLTNLREFIELHPDFLDSFRLLILETDKCLHFLCLIGSGERSPPASIRSWMYLSIHSRDRIVAHKMAQEKKCISLTSGDGMTRNTIRIQKPLVVVCGPFQNSWLTQALGGVLSISVSITVHYIYHAGEGEGDRYCQD